MLVVRNSFSNWVVLINLVTKKKQDLLKYCNREKEDLLKYSTSYQQTLGIPAESDCPSQLLCRGVNRNRRL